MTDELPERLRPLARELRRATRAAGAPPDFSAELERPRDPEHGDVATNAALVLSGRLGESPRAIAERIAGELDAEAARVSSVEVAGPGFINFRLSDLVLWESVVGALDADREFGRAHAERPRRVNVEFVSANPTGPLHVAHGRGAALGDVVASLLEWTGHEVTREFYVNDAGQQIRLLGESVEARWRQLRGEEATVPDGGYRGSYVTELAEDLSESAEMDLAALDREERFRHFAGAASEHLRRGQERDLREFGIEMARWQEESALYDSGAVERTLERLEEAGLTYREEGAVWLRTSDYGDEKDRVLVKSDGSYTYFLPDVAYHLDKAARGFDRAIDVWGADHHGHVPRMRAALRALELPDDFLEVLLIQLVTVLRGGEEARMSKRAGEFVTLRELFQETGTDVARYFFLMRRAEGPLQFDLDLALDTSEKNPVYKIQYAHARICSVFEKAGVDRNAVSVESGEMDRLDLAAEREVAKTVVRFPRVVAAAAEARAPYRVCVYLEELAGTVNSWYHEGNVDRSRRILAEGPSRGARMALARAVQITLRNGLELLGISAPERMVRAEADVESSDRDDVEDVDRAETG